MKWNEMKWFTKKKKDMENGTWKMENGKMKIDCKLSKSNESITHIRKRKRKEESFYFHWPKNDWISNSNVLIIEKRNEGKGFIEMQGSQREEEDEERKETWKSKSQVKKGENAKKKILKARQDFPPLQSHLKSHLSRLVFQISINYFDYQW